MKSKETKAVQKLNKEIKSYVNRVEDEYQYVVNDMQITYSNFFTDKLLVNYSIREGVPYSLFQLIKTLSPFTETQWAHFLELSTKSMLRYRQTLKKFKPAHSEKIIGLAEITNMGLDVFSEMGRFKLWLETPNFALGNIKPFDLLSNSYGRELISGELTRINFGILS